MDLHHVVKVWSWLIDPADIPVYVAVRSKVLGTARPASMLAVVPALVRPDIRVEVEVVAAQPGPHRPDQG